MISDKGQKFSATVPARRKRQINSLVEKEGSFGLILTPVYLGISVILSNDNTAIIALTIRDLVYPIDFSVNHITLNDGVFPVGQDPIADYIIEAVESYEHSTFSKFIGAGLPHSLMLVSPSLCSRLWLELDIVPLVMHPQDQYSKGKCFWDVKRVDEQADSMARKCIMSFGPSLAPLLQVAFPGIVQVDAGFQAHLSTVQNYKDTCSLASWQTVILYANKLRANGTKIAFFSSTPQGGGVAVMRHALVRFSRLMGVDLSWYVPKPQPGVFRITKNIHNILQGVSTPDQRISAEDKDAIVNWITENANRYWLSVGGPLRPPEEGGANVIIVDDPQMPSLIPLIKKVAPQRPVFYRSHIHIRTDLIKNSGSPQAEVWDFLWANIKESDLVISHPVPSFVPHNVPREKVAYLPATTDWLDGLNKKMKMWDNGYYGHVYNTRCHSQRMTELQWPARKYIIQVSRFDPSKGIPTVVDSYAYFRRQLEQRGNNDNPQLVICGNGSVDDPDGNMIYEQTMSQLETHYPQLLGDISIMRLDPNDQMLNCLIAHAHVVLQLSTHEGFEVKVSEALHAGRPVIATSTGGIPLQIKDRINGYLVKPGDWKAVGGHLIDLFTDTELHERMCRAAKNGISDEVSTVGNAIGWYYLAAKWAENGPNSGIEGRGRWVNDLAREEAGQRYAEHENRLPRFFTQKRGESAIPT